MMKTKPIKTITDLRHHQEVLRANIEKHETELNNSWLHLKTNYGRMVWKEINPFKGNKPLNMVLDLLQPGLLPVITEVIKGSTKGNPLNLKVVGSSLKFMVASLGIKWLRKWLELKQDADQEEVGENAETAAGA
jgi:hypothetical protein